MRSKNKFQKSLILIILTSLVSLAHAQEGRFTKLKVGEAAKFNSWCFDDIAAAKIITTVEFNRKQCDGRLSFALEEEKAKHDLMLGNLNLRLDSLKKEYSKTLEIKNVEIDQLTAAALKRPNDYTHWWATGGFLTGVTVSVFVMLLLNGDAGL